MYVFYRDVDDLLDGRTIMYAAKEVGISRERASLILRGRLVCDEELALKFVARFSPESSIFDFFKAMKVGE